MVSKGTDSDIKSGTNNYKPIVPSNQHTAVFYGLAKAAGDTSQASSDNTVGTYTNTAKSAIRTMLGATSSNVIAVQDEQPTDNDTKIWLPETAETPVEVPTVAEMNTALAGKVGDVQVNGASVVSNVVANIPLANGNNVTPGVIKIGNYSSGLYINSTTEQLSIAIADSSYIKGGTNTMRPIAPSKQHAAAFYGLAKAAGDTTQSASSNEVGTYTSEAKAAIKSMLGVFPISIAS